MRLIFIIILALHALIHLLGFVKGFNIKEVKELTMPISKTLGICWLVAFLCLFIYLFLFISHHKYDWFFGILAIIVSQFLIVLFWKDARFGTLPNIIILVSVLISFGDYRFQSMLELETVTIIQNEQKEAQNVINNHALESLPNSVKKWLKKTGIVGKPYIAHAKVIQTAQLKMNPEQEDWLNAEAVQVTNIVKPAFIWNVEAKMNELIYFIGRDKFINGTGCMLIKLNSLFNIVDESGTKISEGSLQRYLGEMVWFPSLALSEYITWETLNDTTAIATMNYLGIKVSGTFFFNTEGDFIKFSAMRYMGNDPNAERQEWVLNVNDYDTFEGIKVPSKMTATWKLPEGDWTWLKLNVEDVQYNFE